MYNEKICQREGEVADEIDGGSEECHLCAANGKLCGLC